MRAMIMNSRVFSAALPAAIFAQKFSMLSWVWGTSVPKREFFFSPVLSSIITADTPMRSSVRTL